MPRQLSKRGFGRKKNTKPAKKAILIVTEGEVSEKLYFQGLKRALKLPEKLLDCHVVPGGTGDVKKLSDIAEDCKKARAKDKSPLAKNFDEIWVIFDTDTLSRGGANSHQLSQRVAFMEDKVHHDPSWNFGYSNPSFEYFMLLHFEYSTRAYTSQQLATRIKEISNLKNPKKESQLRDSAFLKSLIDNWKTGQYNALKVAAYQEESNSLFPHDTPNTKLGKLLQSITSPVSKVME